MQVDRSCHWFHFGRKNLLFQLLWFLCDSFSSCLFLLFNRWMSSLQKYSFLECLVFPPRVYALALFSSKSHTVNKVLFYFFTLDSFSHISSTHVLISSLIFLLVPSAVMGWQFSCWPHRHQKIGPARAVGGRRLRSPVHEGHPFCCQKLSLFLMIV